MVENEYLALARSGKNAFWRYLVTFLLIIFAAIFVQLIVAVPAFIIYRTTDLTRLPQLIVLLVGMAPFPAVLVILGLGVWLLHGRSPLTLLTARPRFAWRRLLLSAGLWLVLLALGDLLNGLFFTPGNYRLAFDLKAWLPYAVAAFILIPIQASTEELLFRGYMMQSLGLLTRWIWLPLLISTLVFTSLHAANSDVSAYGAPLVLTQIAVIGLLLGWITLRSKGLEAALGLHSVNNLYAALLVTYPASSLPSPAVFSMKTINPAASLAALVITALIYLVLMRRLDPD